MELPTEDIELSETKLDKKMRKKIEKEKLLKNGAQQEEEEKKISVETVKRAV